MLIFCLCRKTDLYSAVSDEELDRIVSEIHRRHPNTGYKLMRGHLNARGVRVPSEYINMSIIYIYFFNTELCPLKGEGSPLMERRCEGSGCRPPVSDD